MRSLKEMDYALAISKLVEDAKGEASSQRLQQLARDAYTSSESDLYAISPEMSHVSKEFAAGDPGYWKKK